jgi:hypothetical protein
MLLDNSAIFQVCASKVTYLGCAAVTCMHENIQLLIYMLHHCYKVLAISAAMQLPSSSGYCPLLKKQQ